MRKVMHELDRIYFTPLFQRKFKTLTTLKRRRHKMGAVKTTPTGKRLRGGGGVAGGGTAIGDATSLAISQTGASTIETSSIQQPNPGRQLARKPPVKRGQPTGAQSSDSTDSMDSSQSESLRDPDCSSASTGIGSVIGSGTGTGTGTGKESARKVKTTGGGAKKTGKKKKFMPTEKRKPVVNQKLHVDRNFRLWLANRRIYIYRRKKVYAMTFHFLFPINRYSNIWGKSMIFTDEKPMEITTYVVSFFTVEHSTTWHPSTTNLIISNLASNLPHLIQSVHAGASHQGEKQASQEARRGGAHHPGPAHDGSRFGSALLHRRRGALADDRTKWLRGSGSTSAHAASERSAETVHRGNWRYGGPETEGGPHAARTDRDHALEERHSGWWQETGCLQADSSHCPRTGHGWPSHWHDAKAGGRDWDIRQTHLLLAQPRSAGHTQWEQWWSGQGGQLLHGRIKASDEGDDQATTQKVCFLYSFRENLNFH